MGSTRKGAFLVFRFRESLLLLIFLIDTFLPPSEVYLLSDPKKATTGNYKRLFCSYLCIYRAAHYPFTMQLLCAPTCSTKYPRLLLYICDDADDITVF